MSTNFHTNEAPCLRCRGCGKLDNGAITYICPMCGGSGKLVGEPYQGPDEEVSAEDKAKVEAAAQRVLTKYADSLRRLGDEPSVTDPEYSGALERRWDARQPESAAAEADTEPSRLGAALAYAQSQSNLAKAERERDRLRQERDDQKRRADELDFRARVVHAAITSFMQSEGWDAWMRWMKFAKANNVPSPVAGPEVTGCPGCGSYAVRVQQATRIMHRQRYRVEHRRCENCGWSEERGI